LSVGCKYAPVSGAASDGAQTQEAEKARCQQTFQEDKAMIYKRGKKGTYWFRFRFAGRFVHESARTRSKTLAREAERQRRRELEQSWNRVERRSLPPTFECAATQWMESRTHLVRPNTVRMARVALNRLLPVFGPKLLCDIDARSIQEYQQRRLAHGAQGRTINIETGVLRQILKANECWQSIDGRMRTTSRAQGHRPRSDPA
jgi:hypothetical protein